MQSVLLTAQTLRDPVHERAVVLNGPLTELGTYEDVASAFTPAPTGRVRGPEDDDDAPDAVSVGFSLRLPLVRREIRPLGARRPPTRVVPEPTTRTQDVACDYTFAAQTAPGSTESEGRLRRLQPRLEAARLRVWTVPAPPAGVDGALASHPEGRPSAEVHLERRQARRGPPEAAPRDEPPSGPGEPSPDYRVTHFRGEPDAAGVAGAAHVVGADVAHFLPASLTEAYDPATREAEQFVATLISSIAGAFSAPDGASPAEVGDATPLNPAVRAILVEALVHTAGEDADARGAAALLEGLEFSLSGLTAAYRTLPKPQQAALLSEIAGRADALGAALRAGQPRRTRLGRRPLPTRLRDAATGVRDFYVARLRYLGPLREPPRQVYPLASGADTRDVGVRGEYTAAVLDVHADTAVRYVPSRAFPAPGSPGAPPAVSTEETTLMDAVDDWLGYLGVGTGRLRVDQGKYGYTVRAAAAGTAEHDISHFGVGVSQVLPLVVMALVAPPRSTLLFEQPEVHLHPAVQTRLADFFVALTAAGTQCVVETHSEHLVNRLRYRAGAARGREVADATLIYFVERDARGSHYRPIRINEFGVIPDWPRGFFDESEAVAAQILRTGYEKRRRLGDAREPR